MRNGHESKGLRHFGRALSLRGDEFVEGREWGARAAESDRRAGPFEAQGKQAPPLQGEAGLQTM